MQPATEKNIAPYEKMSPTILSQQPASVPDKDKKKKDLKHWSTTFIHLESSLNSMRNWRFSWWAHWSLLAEYFLPRRYHWLITPNRMVKGRPINDAIIDTTPIQAVKVCASGLWTGLTNPARPWLKLEIGLSWINVDADAQSWIEDTEKKLYTVLAQSNFYSAMAQSFEDVTVFGTSPMIVYEDFEDVIRCYVPCAGEYYLRTGSRFSVDTLCREFTLTVSQIVEMFKIENCPPEIVQLWSTGGGSLDTEFIICHIIEPNFELTSRSVGEESFRPVPSLFDFREIYWVRGMNTNVPLSIKGFHGRPFAALRWSTTSNDPYGRGPCMDALGDTKQIQQETRRKAEFIEKSVRPPMGANPELKNEPSSIIPGQITYTSTEGGKKGFWPLFEVSPGALPPLIQDIKDIGERVNKALFVDVFMAITQMQGVQPRNELELTKRDLERLQRLGPVIELFETEFASPIIQRVLDIMQRRNLLKPKPKSLQNIPLKISYISMMKLAQRSAQSVAIKDVFATMGGLSSAAKASGVPDPLRIFNLDKSARIYSELNNFPIDCIYTDDEVKAHDEARAHVMQQQKAEAQAPQLAMAGVNAAKTLSETQVPGGSALQSLMGGG